MPFRGPGPLAITRGTRLAPVSSLLGRSRGTSGAGRQSDGVCRPPPADGGLEGPELGGLKEVGVASRVLSPDEDVFIHHALERLSSSGRR